jgi:type VI secretion system secreted protein Hcp
MMKARTKQLKAKVVVLIFIGVLSLSLVNFDVKTDNYSGIFGTAASAQSSGILAPVQTAHAIYVKFDAVDGEPVDKDHKDWINLLSFSQGQYLPESSPGVGAGRISSVFEEIIMKKELDKASPQLAEAVSLGKVFPKVDIHMTRATSRGPVTYCIYELTNAKVTSYHVNGSTGSYAPREEVSLNFEQIKVTYMKFDPDGNLEGIFEYGWDILGNQPL